MTQPFREFKHFPALASVFEMATTEMLFDGSLFSRITICIIWLIALEIKCQYQRSSSWVANYNTRWQMMALEWCVTMSANQNLIYKNSRRMERRNFGGRTSNGVVDIISGLRAASLGGGCWVIGDDCCGFGDCGWLQGGRWVTVNKRKPDHFLLWAIDKT